MPSSLPIRRPLTLLHPLDRPIHFLRGGGEEPETGTH